MKLLNEKIFIEYQKKYFSKSRFKIVEENFLNRKNSNFFLTIEIKEKEKILNNFSNPIYLNDLNFNQKQHISFVEKIKKIYFNENATSISFKKNINQNNIDLQLSKNKSHTDFIGVESSIDLSKNLDEIFKNFSKGHKSSIKKDYENLNYEIFDYKNYKQNQIFEMMKFHKKVAGRRTRSKDTWKINEKMIFEKKGLLVKVSDKNKVISYAFIFYNKDSSIYFSSCSDRTMFNVYKNISHKVIWKVIQYLKRENCKKFYLGVTKSIFSKNLITDKNKSIDLFKSSFGGDKNYFMIVNNIDSVEN